MAPLTKSVAARQSIATELGFGDAFLTQFGLVDVRDLLSWINVPDAVDALTEFKDKEILKKDRWDELKTLLGGADDKHWPRSLDQAKMQRTVIGKELGQEASDTADNLIRRLGVIASKIVKAAPRLKSGVLGSRTPAHNMYTANNAFSIMLTALRDLQRYDHGFFRRLICKDDDPIIMPFNVDWDEDDALVETQQNEWVAARVRRSTRGARGDRIGKKAQDCLAYLPTYSGTPEEGDCTVIPSAPSEVVHPKSESTTSAIRARSPSEEVVNFIDGVENAASASNANGKRPRPELKIITTEAPAKKAPRQLLESAFQQIEAAMEASKQQAVVEITTGFQDQLKALQAIGEHVRKDFDISRVPQELKAAEMKRKAAEQEAWNLESQLNDAHRDLAGWAGLDRRLEVVTNERDDARTETNAQTHERLKAENALKTAEQSCKDAELERQDMQELLKSEKAARREDLRVGADMFTLVDQECKEAKSNYKTVSEELTRVKESLERSSTRVGELETELANFREEAKCQRLRADQLEEGLVARN